MVKEISLSELDSYLSQGAVLVDVREQEEVDDGVIPGMTHMPLSRFDEYKGQISQVRPTIFYCRSGKRSMTAGEMACEWTDQPVYSLIGGYLGYIDEL